jgi:hypothetical protein
MSFFKVKNRPLFAVASMIVLWLLFLNVVQRFSLESKIEYLNTELKEYSIERPDDFDALVLNLSTSLGAWDDTKHQVFTLLRPEHCELSYWMSSGGSNSLAKINIRLRDLDLDTFTEGVSAVEVFQHRNLPSIFIDMLAREMTVEQCEGIGGYYSGGCRYGLTTRSVRFYTFNAARFRRTLRSLIMQCGGGD